MVVSGLLLSDHFVNVVDVLKEVLHQVHRIFQAGVGEQELYLKQGLVVRLIPVLPPDEVEDPVLFVQPVHETVLIGDLQNLPYKLVGLIVGLQGLEPENRFLRNREDDGEQVFIFLRRQPDYFPQVLVGETRDLVRGFRVFTVFVPSEVFLG